MLKLIKLFRIKQSVYTLKYAVLLSPNSYLKELNDMSKNTFFFIKKSS